MTDPNRDIRRTQRWQNIYNKLKPKYTDSNGNEFDKLFREEGKAIPASKRDMYTTQTQEEFAKMVDELYFVRVNPTNPMASFDKFYSTMKKNKKKR